MCRAEVWMEKMDIYIYIILDYLYGKCAVMFTASETCDVEKGILRPL